MDTGVAGPERGNGGIQQWRFSSLYSESIPVEFIVEFKTGMQTGTRLEPIPE
jgi:hypothetical protein